MPSLVRVLTLLVLFSIVAGNGILTAKGFYCRDPDTGKLYAVNTTWASSTFCGSYTCKLRKKNQTIALESLRQINITRNKLLNQEDGIYEVRVKNITENIEVPEERAPEQDNKEKGPPETPPVYKAKPNPKTSFYKDDFNEILEDSFKNMEPDAVKKDGDRYLTDTEIKALTHLLQVVKKSDLDAIIEVYNLAQDIYKEIDRTTDENIVEETMKLVKNNKNFKLDKALLKERLNHLNKKQMSHVSYWYEPLSAGHKTKTLDNEEPGIPIIFPKLKDTITEIKDTFPENSNLQSIITPPNNNAKQNAFSKMQRDGFPKLPYYYPISYFQRLASYANPQYLGTPNELYYAKAPCKHGSFPQGLNSYPASIHNNLNSQYADTLNVQKSGNIPLPNENSRKTNPTMMPYPFANPWELFDLYKSIGVQNRNEQSYLGAYSSQVPHAILVNPDLNEEVQDIEQKPIVNKTLVKLVSGKNTREEKLLPEWKTDQIQSTVLSEVRANLPKLLPFPLRKKVKLERVGKVIKLDDIGRPKRATDPPQVKDVKIKHLVKITKETKRNNIKRSKRQSAVQTSLHSNKKLGHFILKKTRHLKKFGRAKRLLNLEKLRRARRSVEARVADKDQQNQRRVPKEVIKPVEVVDEYEVFIEKSTCQTDTEPGFFRVGNQTQPFPACCPQRIGNR